MVSKIWNQVFYLMKHTSKHCFLGNKISSAIARVSFNFLSCVTEFAGVKDKKLYAKIPRNDHGEIEWPCAGAPSGPTYGHLPKKQMHSRVSHESQCLPFSHKHAAATSHKTRKTAKWGRDRSSKSRDPTVFLRVAQMGGGATPRAKPAAPHA